MEPGVFWLSLSFGVHITLVNLGIGVSIVVPLLREVAQRKGRQDLVDEARRLLRFYAATYALGGVFGTAFTVYLFSYYPGFTALLGKITLYNYALAIMALVAHFLSLTLYYYGWNRFSTRAIRVIGGSLALSALLIVMGFRSVFAQLSQPVGVDLVQGKVLSPLQAVLGNPLLPPLFLKSVSAALAMTLVAVAAWHAFKKESELASLYLRPALAMLLIVFLAGSWYAWELRRVDYKFANIFGGLGLAPEPKLDLSWLLLLKIALWSVQVAAVILAMKKGPMAARGLLIIAGVASLIAVPSGEFLNAFSQYPYFIPPSGEAGVNAMPSVLSLYSSNINTRSDALQAITVASTGILAAAAAIYLYYALIKPAPQTSGGER